MLLDRSSPREPNVPHARVQLMAHQLAMVKRMRSIETHVSSPADIQPYGLLSSSVGSGKTYVVISMCLLDKYRQTFMQRMGIGKSTNTTMIVVPSHLYTQWSQELATFAGESLNVFQLQRYEDVSKLYQIRDEDSKSDGMKMLHKYDIFLVSDLYYHMLATTCTSMNISFKRLVIDEADSMRNIIVTPIPATITWFVSASIHSVFVNDSLVLGNAYQLSLSELLKNEVRCSVEFVQESIALPPVDFQVRICANPIVDQLAQVLTPIALKGVNGCDSMAAIKKNVRNDNDLMKQLANLWKEQCEHEAPIVKSLQDMLDSECGADEEELKRQISEHASMLQNAQQSLDVLGIKLDEEVVAPPEEQQQVRPKLLALYDLFKDPTATSIVLFSEYPRIFGEIIDYMETEDIKWTNVDCGTEKAVAKALYAYKKGEVRVVFLHSVNLSCGMNLENTTHIVFMHRVSDALKFQVIGRGQRYGRTGPLTVVELLHANEADD